MAGSRTPAAPCITTYWTTVIPREKLHWSTVVVADWVLKCNWIRLSSPAAMAVCKGSGTLALMSVGWAVVRLVLVTVCMLAVLNSATTTELVLVALVTLSRRIPSSKPVPASIAANQLNDWFLCWLGSP